ncbi:MAG: type II toxin-antitoxin system prevent-host-death family antitoxin [Pseudomonadota bacterium]
MPIAFNIHEAKTQFSKLVAAVERGEKVTICRNGEPVIACVPIEKPGDRFPFGVWKGANTKLDDMHLPTDEATLDDMGL